MFFAKAHRFGLCAVGLITMAAAGCASQDVLSEQTASKIRTVALLQISEPQVDLIQNFSEKNESHSSVYAQMLADNDVHLASLLAEALTRRLGDSGYRVTYLAQGAPAGYAGATMADSIDVRADADAVLVVRLSNVAYVSQDTDTPLQPWAMADVQLVDAHTHALLYARSFNAGYAGRSGKAVRLPVNPHYRYLTAQELEAKPDDSASGLKDAMLAIASAIGEDFAKGTRPVTLPTEAVAPAPPPESAADRDREAAEAMAAQWAATTPAPAAAAATPVASPTANVAAATATLAAVAAEAQAAEAVDAETAEPMSAPATAAEMAEPAPVAEAAPPTSAGPSAPEPPSITTTIAVQTPPAAAPPTAVAPTGVLLIAKALVRAQPTPQGEAIAVLPAGTPVTVDRRMISNTTGTWRYVTSGTVSGWILSTALPQ